MNNWTAFCKPIHIGLYMAFHNSKLPASQYALLIRPNYIKESFVFPPGFLYTHMLCLEK